MPFGNFPDPNYTIVDIIREENGLAIYYYATHSDINLITVTSLKYLELDSALAPIGLPNYFGTYPVDVYDIKGTFEGNFIPIQYPDTLDPVFISGSFFMPMGSIAEF